MADYAEYWASWYTWFTELELLPAQYSNALRMITWFFKTLALAPIIPIILLMIYDLTLWLWRLSVDGRRRQTLAMSEKPQDPATITDRPPNQKANGSLERKEAIKADG